jgi:hypothetical protein
MPRHTGPLPRDVVRDLLGIARALYATRKTAGANTEELARLEHAGKEFADALAMSRTEADTVGHRAAWAKAERATAAVLEVLVSCDDSLAALVVGWAERLKRAG